MGGGGAVLGWLTMVDGRSRRVCSWWSNLINNLMW